MNKTGRKFQQATSIQEANPEYLPNLMHNLPGMAYRCINDSKWSMLFISEGCADITGYPARDLLCNATVSYASLIHPDDLEKVSDAVAEAVKKHTQFQVEYRIYNSNHEIRWVWEKGNAVYDKHHNPVYLEGFILDITVRRKAEEDLKQAAEDLAELNATKDRFFSLLAHDLQNPVYAIISLSEFVAENFSIFGQAEVKEALLQVHNAARGIYTLLENLLDWARLQTGKIVCQKEYVSMIKTVNYALDHYRKAATQKGIELEFVYDEDVMLETDLKLLSSILRNLISNSIKYSYPKSTVCVRMQKQPNGLELCVADHGIGISRRHLPKLFKLDNDLRQYGTANESGSGLGLILVDNFARLLGASVSVESKLNKGSKFYLRFSERI
ncbi:MAG: PAS domain-containing sensor histidine kinase [Candidatus Cloacimonetes bacterium]|nr:PAS domain-containing sensor histidine kinase [Candidatus Cloacimonadota bacterium]MDD4559360.1 PAS domain-containing sensor histidine kinase [Candidatus Cloacimonadota bacterium]